MSPWVIAAIVLLAGTLAARRWLRLDLPRPYRFRPCTGRHWKRRFPAAAEPTLRDFLGRFRQAFDLAVGDELKFRPDDEILAIYRARYPVEGWPDGMELERLARSLRERYGLDLATVWRPDLTLGELFRMTVDFAGPQPADTGQPRGTGPAPVR